MFYPYNNHCYHTNTEIQNYWNKYPCNAHLDENSSDYFISERINFEDLRDKKVLEIGCGTGLITYNLAKIGAEVTAIDISEKSLEIAKRRTERFNVKYYWGNAEKLSNIIPIEPYDYICVFGVLHHTPNPGKIIEQIKKYAHQDTTIQIMLYHRYSWPVLWILLKGKGAFWRLNELTNKYSEAQNCPLTKVYSIKEARRLLKDFVIRDISIEYPVSMANHLQRFKKFIPGFVHWLEKPFGWHLYITAKL